jgi:hypothetical protein
MAMATVEGIAITGIGARDKMAAIARHMERDPECLLAGRGEERP